MRKNQQYSENKIAKMRECLTKFSRMFECGASPGPWALSGGRLPDALFMVFLLDSKGAQVCKFQRIFIIYLQRSASMQPRTSPKYEHEISMIFVLLIFGPVTPALEHTQRMSASLCEKKKTQGPKVCVTTLNMSTKSARATCFSTALT